MKRNVMLKKIISFSLAAVLLLLSPANAFAIDNESDALLETSFDNNSAEASVAAEGESAVNEGEEVSQEENESGDASLDADHDSVSNDSTDNKVNTDDARAGVLTDIISDGEADDLLDDEDELVDDTEYSYKSNGNGTHTKSWTDEDGEAHEEIEDCQYDEDGVCELCGYEKEDDEDEEISLPIFSDGEVEITVTAKKSVLNGATKVKANKIEDGDAYDEIESELNDKSYESGKSLLAFLAYDISLSDDEGNEIEPVDGNVSVSITSLKAPETDTDLSAANVGLVHFKENEKESNEKEIVDITAESSTSLNTSEDNSEVDVAFETESFSIFAVTWSSAAITEANQVGVLEWNNGANKNQRYAYLYIVDQNGNAITNFEGEINEKLKFGNKLNSLGITAINGDYFAALASNLKVDGYAYAATSIAKYSKNSTIAEKNIINNVIDLYKNAKSDYWYYSTSTQSNKTYNTDANINVILTYQKETFTVDLFQYNDNSKLAVGNGDVTDVSVINYLAFLDAVNNGKTKFLEMSDGGKGYTLDNYWKYYLQFVDENASKTTETYTPWNYMHYSGSYQDIVPTLDSNGMISFEDYGTPGYFTTKNYDSTTQTGVDYADIMTPWSSYAANTWTKKAYYNVEFPFELNENGYYVFDSAKQYAVYDSTNHKVTVTDTTKDKTGFWPLGTPHFGMHFTTDFYMTEDGKYNNQDCVFNFSGDDDVWVFIDDELVLNLAGIHDAIGGSINFATGKVTVDHVWNGEDDSDTSSKDTGEATVTKLSDKFLDNGVHTLQVYYLERGKNQSNCKIEFNLPMTASTGNPVDVAITKKDGSNDAKQVLAGAKFALYNKNNELVSGPVVTGEDGVALFEDVPIGSYVLKELESPSGYLDAGHSWNVDVYSFEGKTDYRIADLTSSGDLEESNGNYYIYNYKNGDATIVDISKKAEVSDENGKDSGWENREYKITLTANSYIKQFENEQVVHPSDIVLVIDATYSMYFPADLVEDTSFSQLVPGREYYFIEDGEAATNYKIYYDSDKKTWRCKDASYQDKTINGVLKEDAVGTGNKGTIKEENGSCYYHFDGWDNKEDTKDKYVKINKIYYSPSDGSYTRLKALQEQVSYLINELNSLCSGKCNLGIVYFNAIHANDSNHKGHGVLADMDELNDSTVGDFLKIINGDYGTSGSLESYLSYTTDQSLGISDAQKMLDENNCWNDGRNNFVVLVSDGCPSNNGDTVKSNIEQTKKEMLEKDSSLTMLSVGIDLDKASNSGKSKAQAVLEAASTKDDKGNSYIFKKSSSALETVFDQIVEIITKGTIVKSPKTDAIVTDVIDQRFELITEGHEYGANSIVLNSDGTTTITWTGVTTDDWEKVIYVRAKSDFMGGNVITTNVNSAKHYSGVTIDDNFYKFEDPTVNVHLLPITSSDKEVTILLNSTFSPEELEKALITHFGNNVQFNVSDIANQLVENGETDYIPYTYGTTNDNVGAFKFTLSPVEDSPVGDTATADEVGYHRYAYQLNVKYKAYQYATRVNAVLKSDSNRKAPIQTDIDLGYWLDSAKSDLNHTTDEELDAFYYVNVLDLALIAYKVGGTKLTELAGAKYAIYSDSSLSESSKIGEDVISSSSDNDKGQMLLNGLGVGTYYLKELSAPKKYSLSNEVITIDVIQDKDVLGQYSMTISSDGQSSKYLPSSPITFNISNYSWNQETNNTTYMIQEALFKVYDDVAYTLPETGGRGVYVYTIGGILLMLAGALLLYKNKKNKRN